MGFKGVKIIFFILYVFVMFRLIFNYGYKIEKITLGHKCFLTLPYDSFFQTVYWFYLNVHSLPLSHIIILYSISSEGKGVGGGANRRFKSSL